MKKKSNVKKMPVQNIQRSLEISYATESRLRKELEHSRATVITLTKQINSMQRTWWEKILGWQAW